MRAPGSSAADGVHRVGCKQRELLGKGPAATVGATRSRLDGRAICRPKRPGRALIRRRTGAGRPHRDTFRYVSLSGREWPSALQLGRATAKRVCFVKLLRLSECLFGVPSECPTIHPELDPPGHAKPVNHPASSARSVQGFRDLDESLAGNAGVRAGLDGSWPAPLG
jgi:hypothetical protein